MQRHAMIGAKIVKIEMRLKGFKPLAPNRISSRACKLRTVTILKLKKVLASLYVELNQLHRSNMADFTYAVDWDDLQFPFEMIEESIKSEP